jgi:hypothetical protein
VFDRHSPTEAISEKGTRQLQVRRDSPDERARRYIAVDGTSIYRNGWRLIEHRTASSEHCSRALVKSPDRRCFDSAFALRSRAYWSTRGLRPKMVVVVVLGVPGIVVVVVVVVVDVVVVDVVVVVAA